MPQTRNSSPVAVDKLTRLPTLNGLRAFEAAARHLSMKDAAIELFVTPSAVSQLIRGLEREIEVPLFRRGHRNLSLTSEGQTLLPAVRNAFRLIADAAERVRRQPDGGMLTISATTFFAETWLVPRLRDFAERHPDIDIRITASVAPSNLLTGDADVAIRHGLGGYPGMASDLIIAPPVVPVAAPHLVASLGAPSTAADLIKWPKVHDADRGGWALWFARQGTSDAGPARGPSFDDTTLLRAAVLQGQGVGLLPATLIAPAIKDGQLVAVGTEALIEEFAYYLVAPRSALNRPKIAALRSWISEQVATSGDAQV